MIDIVKKANIQQPELIKAINNVSDQCVICAKFKKAPPRLVVSLPLASIFNEVVATDLKSWGTQYFLVMVDVATRYCSAAVINNKLAQTILKHLFLNWIVYFGAPRKILSDNGGEFSNEQMREFGETFNVKIMTTAAECPFSNGICERQNAVIADSVRKITADTGCGVETALAWSIASRNSLSNHSGFSPNQLVFGRNPALPSVFVNDPPAMKEHVVADIVRDNLNAMHSAREEFVKFESNEKLRRALRHNVRPSDVSNINNGDSVFYKRADSSEWHGPGAIIGRDGKVFLVRHGGVYVRVHTCRLVKVPHVRERVEENKFSNVVNPSIDRTSKDTVATNSQENSDCDCTDNQVNGDSQRLEYGIAEVQNDLQLDVSNSPYESDYQHPTEKEKPVKVKVGHRIRGVLDESGENFTGRVMSRAGKASGKYKDHFNIEQDSDGSIKCMNLTDIKDLEVIEDDVELLVFFNSEKIREAKDKEIENWRANDVFEEMDYTGQELISSRWVVTEKLKDGEKIVKARLVARGFEEDTAELLKNSPTCSKESVRIQLAVAAANKWKCNSIDIRAAYLQGNPITRDVYLKPPEEFFNGSVWKLKKTVYGLSDAARQWYLRVKGELLKLGMTVSS